MTTQTDDSIFFDVTDLAGETDAMGHPSLAEIIADNGGEEGMEPDELAALRACPVGGNVNMGIGGGYVVFTRVAGRHG